MTYRKISTFLLLCLGFNVFTSCQSVQTDDDALKAKAAKMLMFGFRGTSLEDAPEIKQFLEEHPPGGLILFDYDVPSKSRPRNISSPEQLSQLTQSIKQAASGNILIALDQEGGIVARLKERYGFLVFPSAQKTATLGLDSAAMIYEQMAAEIHKMGFNVNFAPVVDLNTNPHCPVIGKIERSYAADPDSVAEFAEVFINAMNKSDIRSCLKHFPGHGSSLADSHLGFTDVSESWQEDELLPYSKLIKNNAVEAIMTAHVFNKRIDSVYPASLSHVTLTDILRKKLGFKGLIISDDMAMSAIVDHYGLEEAILLAVNAGVDLLVFSNNGKDYDPMLPEKALDILVQLVKQDKISSSRMDEAVRRVERYMGQRQKPSKTKLQNG